MAEGVATFRQSYGRVPNDTDLLLGSPQKSSELTDAELTHYVTVASPDDTDLPVQGHGIALYPPALSAVSQHRERRASEARDAEQRTVVTRSPGSGYLREIGSRNSPAIAKASTAFRVNDQWRICFVWRDRNAYEVEIVDYH